MTPLIHDFIDRRDPTRFLDRTTDFCFNQQANAFLTPSFRVEFFDQVIQFSQLIQIIFDLDSQTLTDLDITLLLEFTHFPNQIPETAPKSFNSSFEKVITLKNLLIPAVQPFSESFQDVHFSRFELIFMWRINNGPPALMQLQDYAFEIFYTSSFSEAFRQVKNMKNAGKLLQQYASQKKNYCRVFDSSAKKAEFENKQKQLILRFNEILGVENQIVYQKIPTLSKSEKFPVEFFEDEMASTTSHFEASELQDQSGVIYPEQTINGPVNNEISGFRRKQICDVQAQQILSIDSESSESAFEAVPDVEFFKDLFIAAQDIRIAFQPLVYKSEFFAPYLIKNTPKQLKIADFSSLFSQKTKDFLNKKFTPFQPHQQSSYRNTTITVFVHGFQGNQNDLRYVKNIIQQNDQLQHKNYQHYLLANKFYRNSLPELQIYTLGYNLALEIIHFLSENNINMGAIKNINFVGFSLGNIVVQTCIQAKIFADFLPLLNLNLSINGPHLGADSEKNIVNIGMCFLKCFGSQKCVHELQNGEVDNVNLQQARFDVFSAVERYNCLEVISVGSQNFKFNRSVFVGSKGDGYVKSNSAMLNFDKKTIKLAGMLVNCDSRVSSFLLVNQKEKYKKGPFLDVKTGRNVHITPLIDFQSIEVIVNSLWE